MKKLANILLILVAFFLLGGVASAAPKTERENPKRKHTIHASGRPYKKVGHVVKAAAKQTILGTVGALLGSWDMIDAAVVDPLGVGLQAFADGADKYVVIPFQAAPQPLHTIGDGLYYVYEGVDKVGEVLAK